MKLPSKEILQDFFKELMVLLLFYSSLFYQPGAAYRAPAMGPLWLPGGACLRPVSQLWAPAGQAPLWASARLAGFGWALGSASVSVSARLQAWISDGLRFDLA